MIQSASFVISSPDVMQCPQTTIPEYAFIGRSNVGKSSLINMLTNHKGLAMTSSKPGKTLLINHFIVNDDWYLVDLPGYGYAKRSFEDKKKWSALTDGYFTENKNIDLLAVVVQLIDSRACITKDDEMMLEWLVDSRMPFAVIATKADKLNKTKRTEALEKLQNHPLIPKGIPIIPFSALNGEGTDEIRSFVGKVTEI